MNRFLVGLVCLALSSVAFAEPAKERGAYLGAGLAATTFDDGGAFVFATTDDSDSGFALFGGYKILKYFAVEARYNDFGTFSASDSFLGTFVADYKGVSVHAVGIIPFGDSGWELFGQLGLGSIEEKSDFGTFDEDVGSAGLGVRFSWSRHFSVAAQLDAYACSSPCFELPVDWSVATTMVSFQGIF